MSKAGEDESLIEVSAFGPLRARVSGEEQELTGYRTTTALALLTLRSPPGASIDWLIDNIWRDPPATARRSLANLIARIRDVIGPDAVITQGSNYSLAAHVAVDRAAFLELADRACQPQRDPWDVLDDAEQALALWGADPWPGFDEVGPLVADRTVLAEERVRLLDAAASAAHGVGEYATAIRHLHDLVEERPYHERWWGDLAAATAAAGDRVTALRVLQSARSALEQVGLSPSAELVELEQRLARGVRDSRPSDQLGMPTLRVTEDLPFAGRVREFDQLVDGSRSTCMPTSTLAVVEGPPGAGKSRLIVEAARRCSGHVVVSGRCNKTGWSKLGPLTQILEECLEAAGPEDGRRFLDGFEPILAGYLSSIDSNQPASASSSPDMTMPSDERHERIVRACATVLSRAAHERPHLLLVDDLQWASELVLDVLDEILHRTPREALSILATYRLDRADNPVANRIAEMSSRPGASYLRLGPLGSEEAETILASIDRPTMNVAELMHRTGGNAFFMAEVLKRGQRQDAEPLARLVRARVELVDRHAPAFLACAALVGLDFDPSLVGGALDIEPAKLDSLVDLLIDRGLLLRVGERGSRVSFAHGLVAEAMGPDPGSGERKALHVRLAEQGRRRGFPASEWIEHALGAGSLIEPPDVAHWALEAASQLLARFESEAAKALLERVLELPLDTATRVDTMILSGEAKRYCGDEDWRLDFLEAASKLQKNGNPVTLCQLALAYSAGGAWGINDDPHGPQLLQNALDVCPPDRADLRTRLQARLASYDIFTGSLDTRSLAAERAIDLARDSADIHLLGEAINGAIVSVSCPITLDRTRQLEAEMRTLEDAGLCRSHMSNRPEITTYWSGDGATFRADVDMRRAALTSATKSDRQVLASLEIVLALVEGRLESARSRLAEFTAYTDVDRGNMVWNTVMLEWLAGDVGAALPTVVEAYERLRGGPLRYTYLWVATAAGATSVVDELVPAVTATRVARLPELFLGGFGLASLAMASIQLRNHELMSIVDHQVAKLTGQMIGVPWCSYPSADFFIALLAQAQGHDERARIHRSKAHQVHARMDAPAYDELLARYAS